MPSLTHEVSYKDVATLCDTETEQINKHYHVVTICPRGQRLITDLVDEIRDDHLRQAIRNILTHSGNTYVQQVSQFLPRDGTEIVQWKAGDMHLEVDGGKQHHSNSSAGDCGDGCTLDSQLRKAPMSENQRVVAYDVQNVNNTRHYHWINHLVSTSQRG